jgi:transposase
MIYVAAGTRIFFAHGNIDFRNGIDGLAGVCRRVLEKDPFNGGYFVFKNRSGTQLRILHFDGLGFFLCIRRFSEGSM